MELLKRYYKRLKKNIAIKKGISKPDSMTYAKIERKSDKPVIWLLGTEDFGNLGDHKIALAIRHFLDEHFNDYDVIELSARNYFLCCEQMERMIGEEDMIFGTGGGNFGNQYPASQKIRRDFVQRFPENKIIIMPQTIWYTGDESGKEELKKDIELFANHKRLLLGVREENSKSFADKNFRNPSVLVPDMVLFEKPYRTAEKEKTKAVLCLRSDLEGILDKKSKKQVIKCIKKNYKTVKFVDTQKDYLISTENRESEVNEVLREMSSANLVVTDRLHGMVFSALAETPCIVFDNYNGKVQGIYQWIKDLPYVRYKGVDTAMEQDVCELSSIKGNFMLEGIAKEFKKFAELIRAY